MLRAALPVCLLVVATPFAQSLWPAEEALELEAAWAAARLKGTAALMASDDYFEVTAPGGARGRALMVRTPQPGYWEDECGGWTYGRAALVHRVEGQIDRPFTPLRRSLRVFVKEGIDWRVALSHSVPMRDDPGPEPVAAANDLPLDPGPDRDVEPPLVRAHAAMAAALTRRDVAMAERLTAPEFVAIAADGSIAYRTAFIKRVRTEPATYRPSGLARVRRYGRLAVISWQQQSAGGAPAPAWATRVLVAINGAWLQAAIIGGC